MTVGAVWAFILRRNESGNHLLVPANQVPVCKDHAFRQSHHVPKQRRMGGKALQDSGHIGAAEVRPEVCIELGDFARSFFFLNSRQKSRCGRALAPDRSRELLVFQERQLHLPLKVNACSKLEGSRATRAKEASSCADGGIKVLLNCLCGHRRRSCLRGNVGADGDVASGKVGGV